MQTIFLVLESFPFIKHEERDEHRRRLMQLSPGPVPGFACWLGLNSTLAFGERRLSLEP